MPTRLVLTAITVAAVAALRLWEVALSRRRLGQVQASGGGRVIGERVFPWMVVVHTAWLGGCLLEPWLRMPPFQAGLAWGAAAVWLVALGLRAWVLVTLGRHWNVRLVHLSQQPVITAGPYRFIRHPNYLAVVLEIAALPLLLGAYGTALLGSLANAAVLVPRIRAEETYLFSRPAYRAAFAQKKRLLPGLF
jgi:methyltransferase